MNAGGRRLPGPRKPPSLRSRLMRSQLLLSQLLVLCVVLAVLLATRHETDELLDDGLRSTAEGLLSPLLAQLAVAETGSTTPLRQPGAPTLPEADLRVVWQLVRHDAGGARVLAAPPGAPETAIAGTPRAGFGEAPGWRLYGLAAGSPGTMLYVAQSKAERREVMGELIGASLLAALPIVVLGLWWSSRRLNEELQPLAALGERLAAHDPLARGATLGMADRAELQPVHDAIDALAARLARRVEQERAFSAHAAHALRTPLAGIDAQLAVAAREAPPALQERLARVRAAAARLQQVVQALLVLFRSGAEVQRRPVGLAELLAAVPLPGLEVRLEAPPNATLYAERDLLLAALLNLLDNAARHGARAVRVSLPQPRRLRLHDDGPGVDAVRRAELQQALDAEDYASRTGLGLMLADLVARLHGGRLQLLAAERGFAVDLDLGQAGPRSGS